MKKRTKTPFNWGWFAGGMFGAGVALLLCHHVHIVEAEAEETRQEQKQELEERRETVAWGIIHGATTAEDILPSAPFLPSAPYDTPDRWTILNGGSSVVYEGVPNTVGSVQQPCCEGTGTGVYVAGPTATPTPAYSPPFLDPEDAPIVAGKIDKSVPSPVEK